MKLNGRTVVVTGGLGLLGRQHAKAILSAGGRPILWDKSDRDLRDVGKELDDVVVKVIDITRPQEVEQAAAEAERSIGPIYGLLNNAANNPKMEAFDGSGTWTRAENYPIEIWEQDLAVGLTGAFLCTQALGRRMAKRGTGVIVNILSDLALIGPDQRIYRQSNRLEEKQPVKPPSYCAVKGALLSLTRYFATYWAHQGVRVNALTLGGVENGQDPAFIDRLSQLIPLGRMAKPEEYQAAILFLLSDASSYMTGANLVIDGGRTAW